MTLMIGLNYAGLSAVMGTIAYFNDTEVSDSNSLQAAILDFSVTNQNVGGFIGVELGEDKESISVATKTNGSLGIQYKARAEKISGNDNFCNALQLEASHSAISYNGALLSFNTATTTAFGTWAFEIKLPHTASDFSQGEECNVDLVFQGWRKDAADFSQSGFNDEERIHLNLTSRMIVLNEFLPRPDGVAYGFDFGNDDSDMPQGEWVELYNNSDYSFDLAGWYIRDESATNKVIITAANTYPATTVIGAKSWLVVYMNKAVLNNTGDTVKLFNDADILVDSHAYTGNDYCELEPTPGDENSDTTGGGTCGQVPPNKSYARIPDGIGYWVDPIPTPGRMNALEGENILIVNSILSPTNEIISEEPIVEEPTIEETALEEQIVETGETTTTEEEITIVAEEIAVTEEAPAVEEDAIEEPPVQQEEPVIEQPIVEEEQPAVVEEQPAVVEEVKEIVPEPAPAPEPEPESQPELTPENNNDNGE